MRASRHFVSLLLMATLAAGYVYGGAGCTGSATPCMTGTVLPCMCAGGKTGARACLADGTRDECRCDGTAGGSAAGGSTAGGSGGGGGATAGGATGGFGPEANTSCVDAGGTGTGGGFGGQVSVCNTRGSGSVLECRPAGSVNSQYWWFLSETCPEGCANGRCSCNPDGGHSEPSETCCPCAWGARACGWGQRGSVLYECTSRPACPDAGFPTWRQIDFCSNGCMNGVCQ